jgi:hypothetical protein
MGTRIVRDVNSRQNSIRAAYSVALRCGSPQDGLALRFPLPLSFRP